ncbi:MAG: ParB/RepB/Spo0J family partition protein [Eubacteriales bacterium]|nr:ParB/RepB/Spo0J family partition protein [Eubacteriales bacterium]
MKSSAKNVKLASVDDLFSTDESRADEGREKVMELPLSELHPFKNHPFKVKDDEAMMDTAESIRQYGVLVPAIARPDPNGGYELISGHRRHHASEIAGKETMPVIIRELDDDAATIIMVDSNLQREELIPPLLDLVDEKKMAFNPAYEVSFLKLEEQEWLLETIDSEQATPSLSQAQRMKKFSQDGKLTEDVMLAIMSEEKKSDLDKVTFSSDTLRKYFPRSYTPKKMEETIIKLLEQWQRKRQQQHDR